MYSIVTVDKKYMVIVSEFCHDLGYAPHPSDVDLAARNAEHKPGQTINQASSSGT